MERPYERLKRKILVENLWLFILQLLKEKDYYGLGIRKTIKEKFGFWLGNVTAYKVLYMLKKDAYISSLRKGNIKYYKITAKGKKELTEAEKFLKSLVK